MAFEKFDRSRLKLRPLAERAHDFGRDGLIFPASPREPFEHEALPVLAERIVAAARDRVVRIENTRLSNQADHIVVNSGHASMLFRSEVADLIDSFLRHGRFVRQGLPVPAGTS